MYYVEVDENSEIINEDIIENLSEEELDILKNSTYSVLMQTEDYEYSVNGFNDLMEIEKTINNLDNEQSGWFITGIYCKGEPCDYILKKTIEISLH